MSRIMAPRPSTTTKGSAASDAWWSGTSRLLLLAGHARWRDAARGQVSAPVAPVDAGAAVRWTSDRGVVGVDPGFSGRPRRDLHGHPVANVEASRGGRRIVPLLGVEPGQARVEIRHPVELAHHPASIVEDDPGVLP